MTRLLRKTRGWTQEHLAEVAGLSVRTVQRIEAGYPASPESLMALAAALDLSVEELCDGPHVAIDHLTAPWPGLTIKVFKDGFQVPCVIELDSAKRAYKRLGLLLLDIPEDQSDRLTFLRKLELPFPPNLSKTQPWVLLDGEPYDPWDHIVEAHYDAVIVVGPFNLIEHYRAELPKHWALMPGPHQQPVVPVEFPPTM